MGSHNTAGNSHDTVTWNTYSTDLDTNTATKAFSDAAFWMIYLGVYRDWAVVFSPYDHNAVGIYNLPNADNGQTPSWTTHDISGDVTGTGKFSGVVARHASDTVTDFVFVPYNAQGVGIFTLTYNTGNGAITPTFSWAASTYLNSAKMVRRLLAGSPRPLGLGATQPAA